MRVGGQELELPVGTVTFLLSDIVGSTRAWEAQADVMGACMGRHDAIVDKSVADHGGVTIRPRGEGDSRFAVFRRASDAVAGALDLIRAIEAETWGLDTPLRLRVALHTGEAELRFGDYYGSVVNRCARLRAIANPGQVLVSQSTAQLAREALPRGAALVDLGWHRLKDLSLPEHVFGLRHPDIEGDFPPLVSLDTHRHNLPVQRTTFIGRQAEMSEISGQLRRHGRRLVTLTGPGGAGKTRLALQVAAELLDGTGDGVWLVELASVAESDHVARAVSSALGVRQEPTRSSLDTLVDAVGERRLLVVLDNCEHVIDAVAKLADTVLRCCPGAYLLATSREPLGIEGERVHRVPAMEVPPDEALPAERLASCDAVQLFIARAADQGRGFTLDESNARAVARICRHLDGIPLAIELAAARLGSLSIADVSSRLDHRFKLLSAGTRAAVPRHQTLKALIDWSYDLLSPYERLVLERLSVFAGGCSLDAAEAVVAGGVIDADYVLDLICALADKSLVQLDEGPKTRYRLLETVREYAAERLAERGTAEVENAGTAHRDHYLCLAEAGVEMFHGPEAAAWLARLDVEHDNLRRAMAFSACEAGNGEHALRLAVALQEFWDMREHFAEAVEYLDALLERPDAGSPFLLRAKALNASSIFLIRVGDSERAGRRANEALEIARICRDPATAANALYRLAWLDLERGDVSGGLARTEEAVQFAREAQVPYLLCRALTLRACLSAEHGDRDASRSDFEEALGIARSAGGYRLIAVVLLNLANAETSIGELGQAQVHLEESLALARNAGDEAYITWTTENLGSLSILTGDYQQARELFAVSLERATRIGSSSELPYALYGLALVAGSSNGELACSLHGAADSLMERYNRTFYAREAELRDGHMGKLRDCIGDAAFEQAYRQGRSLPLPDAIALGRRVAAGPEGAEAAEAGLR